MNSGIQAVQNELEVTGDLDSSRPQTVLHLGAGRTVLVPTEFLLTGGASPFAGTPFASDTATRGATPAGSSNADATFASTGGKEEVREAVIPLVAEQMVVGKQTVVTGKVRLHRDVETFTDSVSLPLTRTTWDVERIPVGRVVEVKPEPRQEGDVMVFPLVEERLVARREYILVEEVRVRQVATTTDRTTTLELKRDILNVERDTGRDRL